MVRKVKKIIREVEKPKDHEVKVLRIGIALERLRGIVLKNELKRKAQGYRCVSEFTKLKKVLKSMWVLSDVEKLSQSTINLD